MDAGWDRSNVRRRQPFPRPLVLACASRKSACLLRPSSRARPISNSVRIPAVTWLRAKNASTSDAATRTASVISSMSALPLSFRTRSWGSQQSRTVRSIDVPWSGFGPGLLAPGQEFDDGFLDEAGGRNPPVDREDLHTANDVRLYVDEELLPGWSRGLSSPVLDKLTNSW